MGNHGGDIGGINGVSGGVFTLIYNIGSIDPGCDTGDIGMGSKRENGVSGRGVHTNNLDAGCDIGSSYEVVTPKPSLQWCVSDS